MTAYRSHDAGVHAAGGAAAVRRVPTESGRGTIGEFEVAVFLSRGRNAKKLGK